MTTGTTLATRTPNGAIAAVDELWNEQQKRELKQLLLKDKADQVSDAQFAVFAEVCKRTGLDPFLKQIWLLPTSQGMVTHIGIDGLRQIAIRDGQFDAQDGPYWCGKDGRWLDVWLSDTPPAACKVGVKRLGSTAFTYAVVTYREFKGVSPNWTQKAAHMLAIRAEGHALRKAFQGELSGVHQAVRRVPGAVVEIGDGDGSDEPTPLPAPAATVTPMSSVSSPASSVVRQARAIEAALTRATDPQPLLEGRDRIQALMRRLREVGGTVPEAPRGGRRLTVAELGEYASTLKALVDVAEARVEAEAEGVGESTIEDYRREYETLREECQALGLDPPALADDADLNSIADSHLFWTEQKAGAEDRLKADLGGRQKPAGPAREVR